MKNYIIGTIIVFLILLSGFFIYQKLYPTQLGILHSPVYTFFEKAYIVELNADVETGNLKLGNASTSLYFSNFQFHCQNTRSIKCKPLLTCHEGCQVFTGEKDATAPLSRRLQCTPKSIVIRYTPAMTAAFCYSQLPEHGIG